MPTRPAPFTSMSRDCCFTSSRASGADRPRSRRQAGIGVVGVRLVQVMLGEPQRDWSVVELAEAADSSTGQAHKILTRLESEGLVTVTGRGPARRRADH